jgi:hypothetical protein
MITTHILNSIEELKDGDKYQIQYPMSDYWGTPKIYKLNNCDHEKENLKRLINNMRIRILYGKKD